MNKLIIALFVILSFGIRATAQNELTLNDESGMALRTDQKVYASNPTLVQEGMNYRQLKGIYNYRNYYSFTGEKSYQLGWMGVASAFIPGLGQVIEGEVARGLIQFVSAEGLFILGCVLPQSEYDDIDFGSVLGALTCYLGAVAVDVWSIVDAVRIAKVKNMYYNDLRQLAFDVKLTPCINYAYVGTSKPQAVAGLSMKVSF